MTKLQSANVGSAQGITSYGYAAISATEELAPFAFTRRPVGEHDVLCDNTRYRVQIGNFKNEDEAITKQLTIA